MCWKMLFFLIWPIFFHFIISLFKIFLSKRPQSRIFQIWEMRWTLFLFWDSFFLQIEFPCKIYILRMIQVQVQVQGRHCSCFLIWIVKWHLDSCFGSDRTPRIYYIYRRFLSLLYPCSYLYSECRRRSYYLPVNMIYKLHCNRIFNFGRGARLIGAEHWRGGARVATWTYKGFVWMSQNLIGYELYEYEVP